MHRPTSAHQCWVQQGFQGEASNRDNWLWAQDPNKPIPSTTHANVSGWIIAAENAITRETITNAWRKTGFSYFGVISDKDGAFVGDSMIVGDDPNDHPLQPVLGMVEGIFDDEEGV